METKMTDIVSMLIKALVDEPDKVEVTETSGEKTTIYEAQGCKEVIWVRLLAEAEELLKPCVLSSALVELKENNVVVSKSLTTTKTKLIPFGFIQNAHGLKR